MRTAPQLARWRSDPLPRKDEEIAPEYTFSPSLLSSKGSVWHESGTCKPRPWFWKKDSCWRGRDCNHCHTCAKDTIKAKKKQKKMKFAREAKAAVNGGNGQ